MRYACSSGCPAQGSEQLPGPCRPPGSPPELLALQQGAGDPPARAVLAAKPCSLLELRDTERARCSRPAMGAAGSEPRVSSSRKRCVRSDCSTGFLNEARSWPGWREGDAATLSSSKGRISLSVPLPPSAEGHRLRSCCSFRGSAAVGVRGSCCTHGAASHIQAIAGSSWPGKELITARTSACRARYWVSNGAGTVPNRCCSAPAPSLRVTLPQTAPKRPSAARGWRSSSGARLSSQTSCQRSATGPEIARCHLPAWG